MTNKTSYDSVVSLIVANKTSYDSVALTKDTESYEVCQLMLTNEKQRKTELTYD